MNLQKQAFTLVELIVVVTILGVLSTIGFVSYSSYLTGVRDTNRISNMKALSDGLELYITKNTLPLPDDYVEVKANGETVAYQGYVGKNIIETIEFSSEGTDPKDGTYYSYYLTKDRKYYQLMGFLEEKTDLQTAGIFNQTNAVDYSIKHPTVYGKKLGILTDEFNTPIQEVIEIKTAGYIDLGGINSGTIYNAHIYDGRTYSFSGSILNHKIYSLSKPGIYGAPKGCPDGFVGVPGNSEFSQEGFCLAAYEMSYNAKDPLVLAGTGGLSPTKVDWNIYDYVAGKKIASRKGGFPIAYINQGEAIDACKSMGDGYHLQTENEWMSMARDVEITKENWSGGEILNGYITNGNSNDSSHGCSIDLSDVNDQDYTGRRWAASVGFKSNDTCNETRKYVLSNNAYVRDIGGNLREHVNKANTIDGSLYSDGTISVGTLTTTVQWNDADITSLGKANHGPLFGLNTSSHGIGTVQGPAGISGNIITRGGCAICGYNDGLYGVELDNSASTNSYNYGFRCAYIKK